MNIDAMMVWTGEKKQRHNRLGATCDGAKVLDTSLPALCRRARGLGAYRQWHWRQDVNGVKLWV